MELRSYGKLAFQRRCRGAGTAHRRHRWLDPNNGSHWIIGPSALRLTRTSAPVDIMVSTQCSHRLIVGIFCPRTTADAQSTADTRSSPKCKRHNSVIPFNALLRCLTLNCFLLLNRKHKWMDNDVVFENLLPDWLVLNLLLMFVRLREIASVVK